MRSNLRAESWKIYKLYLKMWNTLRKKSQDEKGRWPERSTPVCWALASCVSAEVSAPWIWVRLTGSGKAAVGSASAVIPF